MIEQVMAGELTEQIWRSQLPAADKMFLLAMSDSDLIVPGQIVRTSTDDIRAWERRRVVWASRNLLRKQKFVLLAFLHCDRRAEGLSLDSSLHEEIAGLTLLSDAEVTRALGVLRQRRVLEVVGHHASFRPERLQPRV